MAERRRPGDITAIPVDEALTLVVGWKIADGYQLGRIELTEEVAEALREACRTTLERLENLEPRAYGSDTLLEREEYMVVPEEIVVDAATISGGLLRAAGLESVGAHELESIRLSLYAVAVGDDPEQRAIFVRKSDPARLARPGRLLATLANALRKVEDPLFVFDDRFDVVLLPQGAIVVNQTAFELLFREVPALAGRYEAWVGEIAALLPFADDGAERLVEAASRDSRLWRRLRSIHERGHLARVTTEQIENYANEQGIGTEGLIRDDHLVFDGANRFDLLKLLNEDLFIGGLTGERFEADRKSQRSQ